MRSARNFGTRAARRMRHAPARRPMRWFARFPRGVHAPASPRDCACARRGLSFRASMTTPPVTCSRRCANPAGAAPRSRSPCCGVGVYD